MKKQEVPNASNSCELLTQQLPEGRKDCHSFSFSLEYLEELEPTIVDAIKL